MKAQRREVGRDSTVPGLGHHAATPNPDVLNAVADAIRNVQESLHGVQPPARQRHRSSCSCPPSSLAAEAVSADFHGDRASKAKQSLAVLAAAKAQLQ